MFQCLFLIILAHKTMSIVVFCFEKVKPEECSAELKVWWFIRIFHYAFEGVLQKLYDNYAQAILKILDISFWTQAQHFILFKNCSGFSISTTNFHFKYLWIYLSKSAFIIPSMLSISLIYRSNPYTSCKFISIFDFSCFLIWSLSTVD